MKIFLYSARFLKPGCVRSGAERARRGSASRFSIKSAAHCARRLLCGAPLKADIAFTSPIAIGFAFTSRRAARRDITPAAAEL